MPRRRREPASPLEEFRAMPAGLRVAAAFWLQHGFWPLDLHESLLARLDAWAARVLRAGPETFTTLRAEAGIEKRLNVFPE